MIAGVVFDLDGVLVDSEPVWEEVRRAVVAEYGGTWLPDAQKRLMGMSTPEWARYLSEDLGVGLPPEEVAGIVVGRMRERYAEHVPWIPGGLEAVHRLAAGFPLGLASSAARPLIDAALEYGGIAELFRVTVSSEEVPRGKPAPDVYLAAATGTGIDPAALAAVEDSSNGIRSAAAAGMSVIAVPHEKYPPDPGALALAGLVLPTIDELTVDAVRRADRDRPNPL